MDNPLKRANPEAYNLRKRASEILEQAREQVKEDDDFTAEDYLSGYVVLIKLIADEIKHHVAVQVDEIRHLKKILKEINKTLKELNAFISKMDRELQYLPFVKQRIEMLYKDCLLYTSPSPRD